VELLGKINLNNIANMYNLPSYQIGNLNKNESVNIFYDLKNYKRVFIFDSIFKNIVIQKLQMFK